MSDDGSSSAARAPSDDGVSSAARAPSDDGVSSAARAPSDDGVSSAARAPQSDRAPASPPVSPPGRATLLALGLVTAATLAEQVVITRLFSSVLAYHFSFLAISIALFGTGAGALAVFLKPGAFAGDPRRVLARWSGWFAFALVVTPVGLVRLDFTGVVTLDAGFAVNLMIACVLAALPALASGVVVALAIDRYQEHIGPVYAADLLGAGVGAVSVVPALWLGPAPELLVGLGALAAIASVLFDPGAARVRRWGAALLASAIALIGVAQVTSALYLPPRYQLPAETIQHAEHWTPLARVFGFELPNPTAPALLFYDRVYAPVPIVYDELPSWKDLGTGPASVGFAFAGPGRALIIGGGGGRDIYNALSSGQRPVDVIELIEGNRRIVDEDLGHLSGRPYSRDGVHTVIGDGRSVLARRETHYNQIHIGFTDTLTANAAQGFALTENNLYTVEAFEDYFDHLEPRGILNVSRLLKLVGDEALRVTVLTLAALERRGVDDPFRHVVVILGKDILGPPTGTVLARLEPFSDEEVTKIGRLAGERADGLLMAPGIPARLEWAQLSHAGSLRAFCESYPLDVCPPDDDRPFFFNMHRLSDLGGGYGGQGIQRGYHYAASPFAILLLTLVILAILSVLGFVVPLALVDRDRRPRASSLGYFAAIGLGFLLLEIVLIQRLVLLLGYPTYSLSVVLFALLLSSGTGAFVSGRLRSRRRTLVTVLAVAAGLITIGAFTLQPLVRVLVGLPLGLRIVAAVLLVLPLGLCLGMAMPLGLRRFGMLYPRGVAFAWGVNGIASVLASVLGMVIAINFGFTAATLAAAACYVFALGHAALGRWPEAAPSS